MSARAKASAGAARRGVAAGNGERHEGGAAALHADGAVGADTARSAEHTL